MTTSSSLNEHPFRRFCQKMLDPKGVPGALQNLYEQHNLNPIIVLFCCWFASFGQGRLSKQEILQSLQHLGNWHARIVCLLQQLSLSLKDREQFLLAHEVDEELQLAIFIEQMLLIDGLMLKTVKNSKALPQRLLDSCRNLMVYCKILSPILDGQCAELLYQVVARTFPQIDLQQTYYICHEQWFSTNNNPGILFVQQRLRLD